MGSTLELDFEGMNDAIGQIGRAAGQFDQYLTEHDRKLESLRESWTGAGAESHFAAHDRWRRTAQDMAELLHGMQATMRTVSENYVRTEGGVGKMWQG